MKYSTLLTKIRDPQVFSFILSVGIHIIVLYFIGSWVISFGKSFPIEQFIVEVLTVNQPNDAKPEKP